MNLFIYFYYEMVLEVINIKHKQSEEHKIH